MEQVMLVIDGKAVALDEHRQLIENPAHWQMELRNVDRFVHSPQLFRIVGR